MAGPAGYRFPDEAVAQAPGDGRLRRHPASVRRWIGRAWPGRAPLLPPVAGVPGHRPKLIDAGAAREVDLDRLDRAAERPRRAGRVVERVVVRGDHEIGS